MADLEQRPKVELEVAFKLNEAEVRALAALTEYGTDAFLKVFYAQLGSFLSHTRRVFARCSRASTRTCRRSSAGRTLPVPPSSRE
jgi:hypothetical protein